jgi:hypothetical protein
VDRESAQRNLRTGLLIATIAVAAFALAFIVAVLYIRG